MANRTAPASSTKIPPSSHGALPICASTIIKLEVGTGDWKQKTDQAASMRKD